MNKLIFVAILCFLSQTVAAQEKGFTSAYWGQLGSAINNSNQDLITVNLAVAPGYAFNHRWFIRAHMEAAFDMFKNGGNRTYRLNGLLGAGVGCNVLVRPQDLLDITLSAGNSLDTGEWNYTWADAGIHWSANAFPVKPFVGVGFRYYASHTSGFGDYWNYYIAFGVRFN